MMEKDNVEAWWEKNTPAFYSRYVLPYPTRTVEWLRRREMILGTRAVKNKQNYLILAEVQFPIENDSRHYDDETLGANREVQLIKKINHDGEVFRACHMPQIPSVIATKTVNAVCVFNCKYPSKPPLDGACNPDLRLRGHSTEGCGLSWSQFREGHLLSGFDDAQICLWDINATPKNKALDAMQIFKIHQGAVKDVAWHPRNVNLFGSVSGDPYPLIWDLRTPLVSNRRQSVVDHRSQVNCFAFHPFDEWVVATGSTDKTVKLFDVRKISTAVYTLDCHKEGVVHVGWNPKNKNILASCCLGKRLMIWDLSRIDEEQTQEAAKDGPPELLFTYGGETSKISDFSWNPWEVWVIAGVAEDNILHIWQMDKNINHDEDDLPGDDCTKGIVHQLENKHLRESESWVNISAHELPLNKCRKETENERIFGKVWQKFSNVGRSLCAVYEPITDGRLVFTGKEKGVALESSSDSLDDGQDGDFVVLTQKNDYPVSPNDLILCSKSWQKGDYLGSGAIGKVYEWFTKDGSFFAVKEISLQDQDNRGQQSLSHFVQEISFLSRLKHENIVRYFGTDRDDTKLYIFLELVPKGSLAALYGKYKLGDSHVSAYTRQILNGLNYLHCQKVVHRDIKCANILVDANGSVKLADFGLAKATEQLNAIKSCKGSPRWMAPEAVNPKKYPAFGTAADIWGLGCTVLEMSTGELPYSQLEQEAALFSIGNGIPPPIPNTLSNDALDFILNCLQVNPDDRPTAAQLLEHPFVKQPPSAFSSPISAYATSRDSRVGEKVPEKG